MTMTMSKNWHALLGEEIKKPYVTKLKEFISSEKEAGYQIFPPANQVFNAFSYAPADQVKVVIIGQDPYHGPGQAHGLSFSVPPGVPAPPSLRNIFKELHADLGIIPPDHGCLEKWAAQGVLLLNATLTVRQGEPKSHHGRGWEQFTDEIVRVLSDKPRVFMLWGRSAQEKCEKVLSQINHNHCILKAAHPSPFSATRFLGCRHFSKANAVLQQWGEKPIEWDLKK